MIKTLNNILDFIEGHLADDLSLERLAGESHYSKTHLSKVFNKIIGLSISEYINKRRISEASVLLYKSNKSVAFVSDVCGYSSPKYFSTLFKKETGLTPQEYRKRKEYMYIYPRRLLCEGDRRMGKNKFVYEVKVVDKGDSLEIAVETDTNESQVSIEATVDENNIVSVTTK